MTLPQGWRTTQVMTPAPKPSALPSAFQPDEHESLIQEYADIGKRYAPLWSKFGPGNTTERKLKSLQAAVAVEVRTFKAHAGEKITDAAVEAEVNNDNRVKRYLDEIELGRLEYEKAEIELHIVSERLRHHDAVLRRGI